MPRFRPRRVALAGALALLVGGAGCTVVFGWRDLQNGARLGGDASTLADGGHGDDDASIDDASVDATEDAKSDAPQTVACGTTQCGPLDGCCYDRGTVACSDASACRPVDGGYLECIENDDCAQRGANQYCCAIFSPVSTHCTRSSLRCATTGTGAPTCDPANADACVSAANPTQPGTCTELETTTVFRCVFPH